MQFISFWINTWINNYLQLFTHNMPECNKKYYSIWLENGSDNLFLKTVCRENGMTYSTRWNHGIQGHREGCAVAPEGKAAPGAGLEGVPRVSKRSSKLLFYWIRLVCFCVSQQYCSSLTCLPPLLHRRMATGTLLVIINTFKHANFIKSSLWRVHYGGAPQQIKLTS